MEVTSTSIQGTTYHEPFIDPIADLENEAFETQENSSLSERAEIISGDPEGSGKVETPPKKVAYIWLNARANDPALSSEERNRERSQNLAILGNVGYEVKFFDSGRAFFDAVHEAEKNYEKINILVFSQHGNPTKCGDFHVSEGKIRSMDSELTPEEQQNGFQSLKKVMAKDSVVVFNSCSTGNKSIEDNIGKVASEVLSDSTVFAPQRKIALDPVYIYKENERGEVVVDSVQLGYLHEKELNSKGQPLVDTHSPPAYVKGIDISNQEVEPYAVRRDTGGGLSGLANTVTEGARAVITGLGNWYFARNL